MAATNWTIKQQKAHEIAEIARGMGLPETDPIIQRASSIWWEEEALKKVKQEEEKQLAKTATENIINNNIDKEFNIPESDITLLAKLLWGEARGVDSKAEQAAVVWCVLNRVDAGYADGTIEGVVTAKYQFTGYKSYHPATEEFMNLAEDVLCRWYAEKQGEDNVGRTLPKDYLYFNGSNGRNWFRKEYKSTTYWDWSLPDPY